MDWLDECADIVVNLFAFTVFDEAMSCCTPKSFDLPWSQN